MILACGALALCACDAKPQPKKPAAADSTAIENHGPDPRATPAATSATGAVGAPVGTPPATATPKDLAEALKQQNGKGLTTPLSATDYSRDPEFKVPDTRPRYAGAAGLRGRIKFAGSSTVTIIVSVWQHAYEELQPGVKTEVEIGHSADAMPALIAGTADIAMVSRRITAEERAAFKAAIGYEPTEIRIGADAIAIFVNRKNPLAQLTVDEAERIFSREPTGALPVETWGELGLGGEWAERTIEVVGPRPGIGSFDVFRSLVLRGKPYRTSMETQVVDQSIVNAVGSEEPAIGFASRFLATRRTRIVPLAPRADAPAVLPSRVACLTGTYPLARPLCFVLNIKPGTTPRPEVQDFVRYCMSYEGQQDSAVRGDYPVSREMTADAYAAVGITMPGSTPAPEVPAADPKKKTPAAK